MTIQPRRQQVPAHRPHYLRLQASAGEVIGIHADYDKINAETRVRDIHPIRTKAVYEWALAEIVAYVDREPEPGTPEADRFDVLATLIAAYEDENWPIEAPDPVSTVRETMALRGFAQADLATLLDTVASVRAAIWAALYHDGAGLEASYRVGHSYGGADPADCENGLIY